MSFAWSLAAGWPDEFFIDLFLKPTSTYEPVEQIIACALWRGIGGDKLEFSWHWTAIISLSGNMCQCLPWITFAVARPSNSVVAKYISTTNQPSMTDTSTAVSERGSF